MLRRLINLPSWRNVALSLLAVIVIAGCDDAPASEQGYIEKANEAYEKGELKTSIIHLKNAIKAYPKSPNARLMLGRIYIDVGDAKSAEKELLRARDLGADDDALIEPLGQTWLHLRKFDNIEKEIVVASTQNSNVASNVLAIRGYAKLSQNKRKEAKATFQQSLEMSAKNTRALMGLARIALANRKIDSARSILERAKDAGTETFLLTMLEGDIAFAAKDFAAAEKEFQRAADIRKDNLSPLLGLARAQYASARFGKAETTLDKFLLNFPNHIGALYMRALTAYQLKDFEKSKELSERILLADEFNLLSLYLAGLSNYAVNELETAKLRLSRFLVSFPDNDNAHRMLGLTLLRLDDPDNALAQLEPLVSRYPKDVSILVAIAFASARQGKFEKAAEYYEKSLVLRPDDKNVKQQLAAVKGGIQQQDTRSGDLEHLLANPSDPRRKEMVDFARALSAKDFARASEIAQHLQKSEPKEAIGFVMQGLVELAQRKIKEGRAAFQKALIVQPTSEDAALNLAKLEKALRRNETAHSVLAESWRQNPKAYRVLKELVALDVSFGEVEKATARLTEAIKNDASNSTAPLLLAKILIGQKQPTKAIGVLETYNKEQPDNVEVIRLLAKTLFTFGKKKQSIAHFARITELKPDDVKARFALAGAYNRVGEPKAYLSELDKIIAMDASFMAAKYARLRHHIRKGNFDLADRYRDELLAEDSDNPVSNLLNVQLAIAEKKYEIALVAAQAALEKPKARSRNLKLLMAEALWRSGKRNDAVGTLETWLKEFPKDHQIWTLIGGYYKELGNSEKSLQAFRNVVGLIPTSWIANNNLAFSLTEAGEAAKAQQYVDAALKMVPREPIVMHTAALVHLAKGEHEQAVDLLAKAVKARPEKAEYKIDYARVLAKTGQRKQAKQLLNEVIKMPEAEKFREKAEKLLQELR